MPKRITWYRYQFIPLLGKNSSLNVNLFFCLSVFIFLVNALLGLKVNHLKQCY